MNPNNYKKQYERGIKRKIELIEYKGGKCEICGYDKNISAFDFHHKDPSTKLFQLDVRHLSNTNIDKIKSEVDKCMLLCSNCHRELHNPNYSIENNSDLLKEFNSNNIKVLEKKLKVSVCPVCLKEFRKINGKIFCSKECEYNSKNYPSKEEIYIKYEELNSWQKVADFYNLTRKIIIGIRKNKK